MKTTWKLIGNLIENRKPSRLITSLIVDSTEIRDLAGIAESFNNYFVNIATEQR